MPTTARAAIVFLVIALPGFLADGGCRWAGQFQGIHKASKPWSLDRPQGRYVMDEAHLDVTELLTEHRGQLDELTWALLTAETLHAVDANAVADLGLKMSAHA